MQEIKRILEKRAKYLQDVKSKKEQELLAAPEGKLRVCNRGGRPQYYERNNPKDLVGIYIREKDISKAQALAQKDYDKKVLQASEKELKAIQNYLTSYPEVNPEQVYEKLHIARQKLVFPICETDEQYLNIWQAVKYQGKEFYENTPEYYTEKGERVRSKSEIIIANLLNKQGIPYRYEYPLYLNGYGKVYPDFTLLDIRNRKEIYWEHLGRMGDADYMEKVISKIALYEQNNIFIGDRLILTFETQKSPLNQKQIKNLIRHYFME